MPFGFKKKKKKSDKGKDKKGDRNTSDTSRRRRASSASSSHSSHSSSSFSRSRSSSRTSVSSNGYSSSSERSTSPSRRNGSKSKTSDKRRKSKSRQDDEGKGSGDEDAAHRGRSHRRELRLEDRWPMISDDAETRAAQEGVSLLFSNRFDDAEAIALKWRDSSPLLALGYGMVAQIRALMTFEAEELKEASSRLEFAEALARKHVSMFNSKKDRLNKIKCEVVVGDCMLMRSLLQFLEESLWSYIRAGNAIRKSYNIYKDSWLSLQHPENFTKSKGVPASKDEVERVKNSARFGYGMFNLVISLLPPAATKITNFLGFTGDRDVGLKELTELAHDGQDIRSPFAALVLMWFHTVLSAFYPSALDLKKAEKITRQWLPRYPDGALFLWLRGRVERLKGNLPSALGYFDNAIDTIPSSLKQVSHAMAYEVGWVQLLQGQYVAAAKQFQVLKDESNWSRAFYAYLEAGCLLANGDGSEAAKIYKVIPSLVQRKFGGRTIPVEAFAMRRAKQFTARLDKGVDVAHCLVHPIWEIIHFWGALSQFHDLDILMSHVTSGCDLLMKAENRSKGGGGDSSGSGGRGKEKDDGGLSLLSAKQLQEDVSLSLFLKATLLYESGEFDAAIQCFLDLLNRDKHVGEEKYVLAYSHYYLGIMALVGYSDAGASGAAPGRSKSRASEERGGSGRKRAGTTSSVDSGTSEANADRLVFASDAHARLEASTASTRKAALSHFSKGKDGWSNYDFMNRLHIRIHSETEMIQSVGK